MKIRKFKKINERFYTSAIRFFKGDSIKFILSYSKAHGGNKWHKWHNKERKPVNLAYCKSVEDMFTARALVVGKHKFSLLVAR